MLAVNYQVVDVLMLVGNLAPIALYFLILGLVNSYSRPVLTSQRSDFIALSCVLIPVLLWPLPMLAQLQMWWLLLAGICLAAFAFSRFLPTVQAGFVIYNIPRSQARRVLHNALQRIGQTGEWQDDRWQSDSGEVVIRLRRFSLLRNVTFDIETHTTAARKQIERLSCELDTQLAELPQLPSAMGACLVMIGLAMMMMPMWMVGRHIRDLVDAMTYFLD